MQHWNGTPVGEVDEEWKKWYRSAAWPLCREQLVRSEWSCTLTPHHTGPHVAHFETTGKVAGVDAPPIHAQLMAPEGL